MSNVMSLEETGQSFADIVWDTFTSVCDEHAGKDIAAQYAITYGKLCADAYTTDDISDVGMTGMIKMLDEYAPPLPMPMQWDESALNYHVDARPLQYTMDNGETNTIHDEKALVRLNYQDDVPWWLANVGKDYKVVQNQEILQVVEAAIRQAIPDSNGIKVRDVTSYHGRDAIRHYTFEGMKQKIGKVSELALTITAMNSFGKKAVEVRIGALDFTCANGMMTVTPIGKKKQHTSGLNLEDLTSHIKDGVILWKQTMTMYETWANLQLPKEYSTWVNITDPDDSTTYTTIPDMFEFLKNVVGTGTRCNLGESTIHDLINAYDMYGMRDGHTMWALYSALTHWASDSGYNNMRFNHPKSEDGVASTLLDRQMNIYKVVNGKQWDMLLDKCKERPEPYSTHGAGNNTRAWKGEHHRILPTNGE